MATAISCVTILAPVHSLACHCIVSTGWYQQTLIEGDLKRHKWKVTSKFAREIVLSLQNICCIKPQMQLSHHYFTASLPVPAHNLSSPLSTYLLMLCWAPMGEFWKWGLAHQVWSLLFPFLDKLSTSLKWMQSYMKLDIPTEHITYW